MSETSQFLMPALGADMEAGTLLEWRVAPGDRVERGDIVALVDTDKATIEVEIFTSGVVRELLVEEGRKVPVGTPLATIATAEPASPRAAGPPTPPSPPVQMPAPEEEPPHAPAPPRGEPTVAARRRVTPLARRVAEQLGVDLATVEGTGAGGAVRREDVERAVRDGVPPTRERPTTPERPLTPGHEPGREPEGAAAEPERAARMRRAIAAAMARSKREIPHYYLEQSVDMSRALAWLHAANRERTARDRLVPAVLMLRAVALAAREVPEMNGYWQDDRFQPSAAVHVGVAIGLRDAGLVAPAIRDADEKGLDQVMRELSDLVARAKRGRLRSSELSDATITFDSLGVQGVERVFGVIYPPQVALVGFGSVVERPWAVEGMLGVRPIVSMTLSGDHRASDGFLGARFLKSIDRLLNEPERL